MSEWEDACRRVAAGYRRVPVSPDAKQRLLDRIAATPPPRRGWVMAPRWTALELRISPIVAASAVAVAFLLGATFTRIALGPPADHARPPVRVDSLLPVRFTLIAPGARTVSIAGDFNRWDTDGLKMTRVSPKGVWSVTIDLPRGSHYYSFVVDGHRWMPDPTAPLGPDDGFGSRSSVVVVRDLKAT